MRLLTITANDREWHEAFHDYIARVFPSVSFRRWAELGGWQENYRVLALVVEDRIVASVSLTRMSVVLGGCEVRGWQLGAVGTDPNYRGRGLQHSLMQHALAQPEADDLVFLFANEQVLGFYPRFGFRRVRESVFALEHRARPAGTPLRALTPDSGEDRALIARIAQAAATPTTLFGARGYGSIVLWYICNFHRDHVRYVPEHDALIVAERAGSTLLVYDVLARAPFDVAQQLPRLLDAPIDRIQLFYSPERDWPSARPTREYRESPLFVRGPHAMPQEPFKFPALAQT
jgi:ribosomal protein S18 acetylase RimI-like enzyme